MNKSALLICAISLLAITFASAAEQGSTTLVKDGKDPLPIVISDSSSERTRDAAEDLAKKLTLISGAEFTVVIANDASTPTPAIRLVDEDNPDSALDRELYRIHSTTGGNLILSGSTDLAVQHAVWDLLHRLGYRHYFPGDHWEIAPASPSLTVALDVTGSPDYAARSIWPGFAFWKDDDSKQAHAEWEKHNRMGGGFALNTGHAYGRLIRSQQTTFDAHPEYYALVDGERRIVPQAKLCISNPGVHQAAVAYALEYFEKNPDADSVSIDPSDGGHWCECQDCAKIGSPTDNAITLANTIARALERPTPTVTFALASTPITTTPNHPTSKSIPRSSSASPPPSSKGDAASMT